MVGADYTRRQFLGTALVAGGGAVVLAACTGNGSSNGSTSGGGDALPPLQGATVVTDKSQIPAKLAESPAFADLVKAGRLPSVEQRIGQDPLVMKPVEGAGKYGGELRRAMVGVDFRNGSRFSAGPDTLLYFDYKYQNVIPNLARDYELSSDGKVVTLHLRRGMRWSDGQPFTADDIVFWSEDIDQNSDITPGVQWLKTAGGPVQIKKVDEYTVEYVSPISYPILPRMLASPNVCGQANNGPLAGGGLAPKHYLTKFLPKYTSQSQATKLAKEAGFASWPLHMLYLMDWSQNTDLPVLSPWTTTQPVTKAPWIFEANPYSIWVDTAGNQLPYIPKITIEDAGNTQVLNLRTVSGQYDFQDRGLQLSSLPVLVRNEKRSEYTVYRAPSTEMDAAFRLNLAYVKDKVIGDLLRETDFRRALSLGVDREQINQIHFLGTSHPSADLVADSSPYFPGKDWRLRWATHDVPQANKLLDGLGLTKRDSSGYRLRPDGKGRIELEVGGTQSYTDFGAVAQSVVPHWKDIGIFLSAQTLDSTDSTAQIEANELMIECIGTYSTDVFIDPSFVLPTTGVSGIIGIPYAQWLTSGGKTGVRPPASLRLEDGWRMYQEGLTAPDARRNELGKQIYKLHADLVWSIGFVGQGLSLYGLYTASDKLGNVPHRFVNNTIIDTPNNAAPVTFYYKS